MAMRATAVAVVMALAATVSSGAEIGRPPGSTVSIVDAPARLCPESNCGEGEEKTRIPVGTRLTIEARRVEGTPFMDVVWYRVSFAGTTGWVSEHTTDAAPKSPRLKRRP